MNSPGSSALEVWYQLSNILTYKCFFDTVYKLNFLTIYKGYTREGRGGEGRNVDFCKLEIAVSNMSLYFLN